MDETFNTVLQNYFQKWDKLATNQPFLQSYKPVAIGWKTEDRVEYDQLVKELHDRADRIIETWMNGRWIAKIHLRDQALAQNISIIKIMQRRPGSTDAVGLDHVDFYSPEFKQSEAELKKTDLKWSWESNDVIEGYDWISVWFDGTEAKLKSDTVLDIVAAELTDLSTRLQAPCD